MTIHQIKHSLLSGCTICLLICIWMCFEHVFTSKPSVRCSVFTGQDQTNTRRCEDPSTSRIPNDVSTHKTLFLTRRWMFPLRWEVGCRHHWSQVQLLSPQTLTPTTEELILSFISTSIWLYIIKTVAC